MRLATAPSKTQTVYLLLRDQIDAGGLAPGARLPGEPALAVEYGVSRVTIRRALERLAEERLIERRPGSGTFVRGGEPRVRAEIADVANVFSQLIEMGRTTDVRLLAFGYLAPPERVRDALDLEPDERVQRSVRVRLVDNAPFSHLTAHVPERIGRLYTRDDLSRVPLLQLLERGGLRGERARQEISSVLASPEVADVLGLEVGAPLVSLTRVVYDAEGQGIEHLHALYRPDRYSLTMDLVRMGGAGRLRWSPTAHRIGTEKAR